MRRAYLALAAAAVAAGCTPVEREPMTESASLLQGQPIGEPVDCIDVTNIHRNQVRDDRTIDFFMRNGSVYRNQLTSACPSLKSRGFSYRPTLTRLCSINSITVLQGRGVPGAICGLGTFQQMEGVGR